MNAYIDTIDTDPQSKPPWNNFQLFLASFCLFSITTLFKLPIDFYFGSGWTVVTSIIFVLGFASPVIFLQMKYGSLCKTGVLGIMDRYIPLGLIFTIGITLRNVIQIVLTSGLISHALAYIFFTLFNCDNKLCFGGVFPWSSCKDNWVDGDCRDKERLVYNNPTSEEKFYQNFINQQTSQIITIENFPSWFEYPALITVPHLIGWLLLFLMVIGGARIFGYILYAVVPITIVSFLVSFVYCMIFANNQGQWTDFLGHFFTRFPNHVPVDKSSWDLYAYEPLVWGLLSTFAHLTISMNLWYGIYPVLGKWIGYGKKRNYLCWMLIALPFLVFLFLTTLLNVAMLSTAYSKTYLRCHVCRDYMFPFTVAAHVFTALGTPEPVVVLYYVAQTLFMLLSSALLLITSLETIINHLGLWHEKIANNSSRYYKMIAVVLCVPLYFLSYTTILRSGLHWIQLMDFYVDRLICMLMIGQAVCLMYIFAISKEASFIRNNLVKIVLLVFFGLMLLLSFSVLVWYAIDSKQPLPTQHCHYERLDPRLDPIPVSFRALGWIISVAPFVVGLILGLLIIYLHSRKIGLSKTFVDYFLRGDEDIRHMKPPRDFPYDPSVGDGYMMVGRTPISTVGSGKTTNVKTTDARMNEMRNTLQSSGGGGAGGTYSNIGQYQKDATLRSQDTPLLVYANDDQANFMIDQRQSVRRPLVHASRDEHNYSNIPTQVPTTPPLIRQDSTTPDDSINLTSVTSSIRSPRDDEYAQIIKNKHQPANPRRKKKTKKSPQQYEDITRRFEEADV